MKHLLIILSFLLLSSPVMGDNHKGVTLYKWKTSSGIKWKDFGDKDIQAKYKGDIENGKPHGLGTIRFPDGAKYSGEWKNGKADGQGTFISHNGEQYVGEWIKNRKHGQGKSTLSDGLTFEGEWNLGKPWTGTQFDKEGNILYKVVKGKNKLSPSSEEKKEGVLYFGIKSGKIGWFKEKWEGYIGKYKGEIIFGKPNGKGFVTFDNGETFKGELKDGVPNGQGTATYKNGSKYVGGWKDDKRNGQGTLTLENGLKYVGDWKDNKKWNGNLFNENNKVLVRFNNGKEIKP
jgi:hypothetical protein